MRSIPTQPRHVLAFGTEDATLERTGGKGMNLSLLVRAGLPVPDGFIITTSAYRSFLSANRLSEKVSETMELFKGESTAENLQTAAHQSAADAIGELFRGGTIDPALRQEVLLAYEALGSPPVAVRSSATAEDLPGLSFAGQQDTYLNVLGADQLISAVVSCWASLWSTRAIRYRLHNGIASEETTIAVVVQNMVNSEASGVIFTANPLTGLRSETVVESVFGLGEALVSGQVEPDRFVIDTAAGRIVERDAGSKATVVSSREGGGTRSSNRRSESTEWSLTDSQVLRLAQMAARVEEIYGTPQDIEWALDSDTIYLLQSRPITSLFPLPEVAPSAPLHAFASFAAIQGLMGPLTPFGADLLKQVFASASHLFGFDYTRRNQRILWSAGGRLWVNMTTLLRNAVGRRAVRAALTFLEPTVRQALDRVLDDPRLAPDAPGITPRGFGRAARFFLPVAGNLFRNLAAPERRRKLLIRKAELVIDNAEREQPRGEKPLDHLGDVVDLVERITRTELPPNFVRLVSGVATGMLSLNLLNHSARSAAPTADRRKPGLTELAIEVMRGVPNNPTTEMDLELWKVAKLIKNDSSAMTELGQGGAGALARLYSDRALLPEAQDGITRFLDRYGARGLAEIDAGRPRWRDEPESLFETLMAYLQISDPERSPEAVFESSRTQAEAAVETIVTSAARSARGILGRARAARARFAATRARGFLGFREYPKFFAVRLFDIFRRRLLAAGEELSRTGGLDRPDDLVYLTLDECSAYAGGALTLDEVRALVDRRRGEYRSESARRQIPRLLLSDGRAFYEGILNSDSDSTGILGSPVSPGVAKGRARVVLDPRRSELLPGEIMVCPGTDPSWTPLFLVAAGLVMEVGGMMTHGAVVAREYGIPAVVGVHEATSTIPTGTLIRIDGSNGSVTLLED